MSVGVLIGRIKPWPPKGMEMRHKWLATHLMDGAQKTKLILLNGKLLFNFFIFRI